MKNKRAIKKELLRIKGELEAERVSWGELAYLQDHTAEILELGDPVLAEAAGIPEEEFATICCR